VPVEYWLVEAVVSGTVYIQHINPIWVQDTVESNAYMKPAQVAVEVETVFMPLAVVPE